MKPILEIQSISKKFRLTHEQKPYLSLRESMMGIFRRNTSTNEDFYALRDVSFDIQPGESLGIIGKNGAGKSTLLKILSKITPPSSGKIVVRGRIASLLEVGTGFHPELSGRENIFLNGSILGMKQKEIAAKFDEIVDFSGTEKFLDTPLKHFSSGMQLRLAFSVAAFLEPEILVIDEVLAVGDAEFQKKCIGKMEDVSKSGRTILFVSHNLGAISQLCQNAILLKDGQMNASGKVTEVINAYVSNTRQEDSYISKNDTQKDIHIRQVIISRDGTTPSKEFKHSEQIHISISLTLNKSVAQFQTGIAVLDENKTKIFTSHFHTENNAGNELNISCIIPSVLCPGNFSLDIAAFIPNISLFDYVNDVCPFTVLETGSDMFQNSNYGKVFVDCKWKKEN